MKKLLVICLAFLMLALTGCGGGGGTTTTITPDPNLSANPDLSPVPAQSEGTKTAPVLLSVDAPHNGGVGGLDSLFSSYYTFRTISQGGYIISVENTHSDFSYMVFSDIGYAQSVGSFCNETYGPGDEKCIYTLLGNADYYVDVTDRSMTSDTYVITVREIKSEGTAASPVQLASGVTHTASVDAASSSYYSFTPQENGAYTFAVTNPRTEQSGSSTCWNCSYKIDVYANSDFSTSLLRSCSPSSADSFCTANGLNAGSAYYIKLTHSSDSDMIFFIAPQKGISEGSAAGPVQLTVGQTHSGGVDARSSGYDKSESYYKFDTVGSAGGYSISLSNSNGASSLSLSLYADSGFSAPVGGCDLATSNSNPCQVSGLDPDKTYYLRIANSNNVDVTYDITVTVTAGGSEGSVASPAPLTVNQSHAGSISPLYGNSSYYKFTTGSSGTYKVSFTNLTGLQGIEWNVYANPDFTGIIFLFDRTVLNAATPNLDMSKTYYLKVRNLNYSGGSYTLTITPGNSEGSVANPVPITVGASYHGKVGNGEKSYYSFTTTEAGRYAVMSNNATETWIGLYYDAGFTSLSPYSCGPGTSLACDLQENLNAGGTYFLTVSEWSHVDAAYDIKLFRLDDAAGCTAGGTCTTFEGLSGLPAGFATSAGSSAPWVIDSSNAGDYALKSGTPGDSLTSCVETTVNSWFIVFSLSTSAETDMYYDYLKFYIDGVQKGDWSGVTPWKRVLYSSAPGTHTYRWCYEKDSSDPKPYPANLQDAVWIDDVEIY